MKTQSGLAGKKILIVDDEPDILDTLEELLDDCAVIKASSFHEAEAFLKEQDFDMAILDIMGVDGYKLLEIAKGKNITTIMLTARAVTPDDIAKSYKGGADFYVPKEEMVHIATFLEDVLEAKKSGKNPWGKWYQRLADFCERKFGEDWQDADEDFRKRFPFY